MFEFIIAVIVFIIAYFVFRWYFKDPKRKLARAICILVGQNNSINGLIYLNELSDGNTHIYGKIINLPPGKHAFHIHEYGNMIQGCSTVGGHYNPFNKNHGARVIADSKGNVQINYNRHVGDLGNIIANKKGEAVINFVDPLVKLTGTTSVIGRSIVVHAKVDDLGLGETEDSLKTGSAGIRMACGIIGLIQ